MTILQQMRERHAEELARLSTVIRESGDAQRHYLAQWVKSEDRIKVLEAIIIRAMRSQREIETEGRAIETALAEKAMDAKRSQSEGKR